MLFFFVILCLFGVCFGQKKPELAETFQANITVELHRHGITVFGRGVMARDGKEKGIEAVVTDDSDHRKFFDVRLDRYDKKTEFYMRGTGEDAHCSSVKVNRSDLFPFWGWLANAMYIGNEVIEHKEMALWEDEVAGVRFLLGVNPDNYSDPFLLRRRDAYEDAIVTFDSFNAKVDDKLFEVPNDCPTN